MVKVKNKKRNLADNVNNKKDTKHKKVLNPFEVHINKEKIRVLGRKLKNDRGLPGISRAKALQKRKHTLLPEYKVQNKSNKFTDRRIGERSKDLSRDEKSMARYAAIRVKQFNKKSIFNLADDEILTHKGQTLSEIENFDDPRSEDEDEDEQQTGKLDSKFVEDAHFGGGMLKKADGAKSHKDLIDQLIAESKKRKAEKQKQKEATLELTEKLDSEWKDLLPIVNKSKNQKDEEAARPKVDDYDKVMRELRFEARGVPSDKLKTEDDIAREEKEKLERLERERLDRMHGVVNEKKVINHRSADDLDDNFAYDDGPDIMLSYDDEGMSNVHLENINNDNNDEQSGDEAESEEEMETDSEDNLSDLKESDDNSDIENENNDGKDEQNIDVEGNDDEENDYNDDEEENDNNDDEENIDDDEENVDDDNEHNVEAGEDENDDCDEESKDEDSEENENKIERTNDHNEVKITTGQEKVNKFNQNKEAINKRKRKLSNNDESNENVKRDDVTAEEIREDLLRRKEMMEQARKELPYTYSLPKNYESLQKYLENQPSHHQGVIIERMIKCNHPSLKEGNKDSLGMLFVYLLQHLNDISTDVKDDKSIKECFQIFSCLTPQFFDLAQLNPENAHSSMLEVIKEKQGDLKNNNTFPKIDVLLYLKLISCLFSTSDFRHQVVSPCIVFIEQMLTKCKVRTRQDVAYGLFLVCQMAEFTTLSKRYLPATIKFLCGILHMAIPKRPVQILKVLPPFKNISSALVLNTNYEVADLKLDVTDLLSNKDFDDLFRVKAMNTTLGLLKGFYKNFESMPSCLEIFEQALFYLNLVPRTNYSKIICDQMVGFVRMVDEHKNARKLEFIVMAKRRPKALRLYEPNVVKIFDRKSHKVQSREKTERDKLLHKLKREQKGALREIRRDKAFLGRIKINQQIQSDYERKEKVKRIFSEAAMQQSELNTMDRKNKKK